jgi:deoxyadenosine/deoxycytidine kinase
MSTIKMPRIYSVEGSVGCGKTTLLEHIESLNHPKIVILKEPVDEWTSVRDKDGENILEKYYKDPKTYSFPFQILAFHTRLQSIKKTISENPDCDAIICERSLHADGHIFAKMLYDDGLIDDISYKIYQKIYESGIDQFPLAGIIYLDVPPEVCAERIVKRGRSGEEGIPITYLKKCHDYHEAWLKPHNLDCPLETYTNVDALLQFVRSKEGL